MAQCLIATPTVAFACASASGPWQGLPTGRTTSRKAHVPEKPESNPPQPGEPGRPADPDHVPPTPPDEPAPVPVQDPPAEPVTPPFVVAQGERAERRPAGESREGRGSSNHERHV